MPSERSETDGPSAVAKSDESLLARFRHEGDDSAFAELVRRYEKELFGYLARYVGDSNLADDVFQRTFVQVFQKSDKFDEGRKFRPWLYSVATNQAIDAMRRKGRHAAASLDHVADDFDGKRTPLAELVQHPGASAHDSLEAEERREMVRRTVSELPNHLREVVVLAYFQGWKYQEVADHMNIPVGTVKSRLNAALRKLEETWSTTEELT